MLRTLAVLGALLPGLALAQAAVTVTETSDVDDRDDEIININECNAVAGHASRFSISWTVSLTNAASGELRLSTNSGCPDRTEDNLATTVVLATITSATGSVESRSADDLVKQLGLACDAGTLRTIYVCAVTGAATTVGGTTTGPSQTIRVDTQTPAAPRVTGVTPGDGALDVAWETASGGASRYRVEATRAGTTEISRSAETTDTSKRISNLQNNVDYEVRAVALSIGGNESLPSAEFVPGRPLEILDFWRNYQQSGGQEEGGCSTGGGPGAALLALAALLARLPSALRRGRRS
jgi:hypothetical protein